MSNEEDQEPMTGWDSPEDLDTSIAEPATGAGRVLLLALHTYLNDPVSPNRAALLHAMSLIDWNAVDFTLNALAEGQEIFSAFTTNDVLIKYQHARPQNPDQRTLAF